MPDDTQTSLRNPPVETLPAKSAPTKRPRRLLSWLLMAGLVLIALAAGYVHYWLYLPMGSGPAGRAVP